MFVFKKKLFNKNTLFFGYFLVFCLFTQKARALRIFVSISPQAYLVEKITGSGIPVHILMKSSQNPHLYNPTPQQLMLLANSDIYFSIGLPIEAAFVKKYQQNFKHVTIVPMNDGIKKRTMTSVHSIRSIKHSHKGLDPHIWLSPVLAKQLASNIYKALVDQDPKDKDKYLANLKALHTTLDTVHRENLLQLKPFYGRSVLVFHPAFGYFLSLYHLKQIAIEIEGKEASLRYLLNTIARKSKENNIKTIFTQPQFAQKSLIAIAQALKVSIQQIDPLEKDLIYNYKKMTRIILENFSQKN